MGQGLNKVKRRIQTVDSTKKITSAMKLVSSVKFSKLQKELNAKQLYLDELQKIGNIIFNAAKGAKMKKRYFEAPEEATKNLYVLVNANMGLCGAYNHNIYKLFTEIYKKGDEVLIIGDSLLSRLEQESVEINTDFIKIDEVLSIANIRKLAHAVLEFYKTKKYKKISLIYTHYKNVISYEVKEFSLLPLSYEFDNKMQENPGDFEPNLEYVVNSFINKYLTSQLYLKIYESHISEQASRRNAMDNADKNAEDLIDKLTLEYNKARQAAITQEITEIVGGAANK